MTTPFYRATFEKQLTGTALGGVNCTMASAAMLADQDSLGLKNPSPDSLRRLSGDTSGGMTIGQVGSVLNRVGVHTTVYDGSDGYTFDKLVLDLRRGRGAVVLGDYDVVPDSLCGDRVFGGFHAEYWPPQTAASGVVVGDPLCDGRRAIYPKGYVTYPMALAREYVEKYDRQVAGQSIHAAVMDLKRIKARAGVVNVRAAATRSSAVLGTIRGTTALAWGGTVAGENIGGNNVWFRVWHPATSRLAYCHSSVVVRI